MNSPICVDASFVLKLYLPEDDSDKAQQLWSTWLTQDADNVHRKTISAEKGHLAIDAFVSQKIRLLHPPTLVERAWSLAAQFQRPTTYDVYYVALAEILGCEFWTADRRLYNVVNQVLPWVKFLADFRIIDNHQ